MSRVALRRHPFMPTGSPTGLPTGDGLPLSLDEAPPMSC
jgi:hypothetical protein